MMSLLGRAWTWRTRINITLVLLIGTGLVGLLAFTVLTAIQDRADALKVANAAITAQQASAQRASKRVTQLLAEQARLEKQAQENGDQLALLRAEIAVLERQIHNMGGQPVIITSAGASPEPSASASARPSPRPTHSPSPRPSHTPTPCIIPGVPPGCGH